MFEMFKIFVTKKLIHLFMLRKKMKGRFLGTVK